MHSRCWLKYCHAINTLWIAMHCIDYIAICFLDQPQISPTEREGHRGMHTRNIHLLNEVFHTGYMHARITIEFIKPGITLTVSLAMIADIRWEKMCMKIDEHGYYSLSMPIVA